MTTATDTGSGAPQAAVWPWLLLVAGIAVAVCLPFLHMLHAVADEGVYLTAVDRLRRGERLYADFFEFLPPGGFLLTAGWFGIAPVTFASARLLAMLTIVCIALLGFLACRAARASAPLSAVLVGLWLMMSQPEYLQIWHHWFTTLFSMLSLWAALRSVERPGDRRWLALAGLAGGCAAFVTSTRGTLAVLAGATLLLARGDRWRRLLVYSFAVAAVPALIVLYLVSIDALRPAFEDVVLFTGGHYAGIQAVPFGWSGNTLGRPLVFAHALAAGLAIALLATDRKRDGILGITAAYAIASLIGSFPRPDVAHIAFNIPLLLPLLAVGLTRIGLLLSPPRRIVAAALLLALCLPSAASFAVRVGRASHGEPTTTARGPIVSTDQLGLAAMLHTVERLPGTGFFYPNSALLPFLADRPQASRYDTFFPYYTTPAQYADTCRSLVAGAGWVVIDRAAITMADLKHFYLALPLAEPPEKTRFEHFLDIAYAPLRRVGPYEIRVRRAGADASLCAAIDPVAVRR